MKLLQQQFNSITRSVLTVLVTMTMLAALPVAAAPGDPSTPPLNPGNEAQPIQLLRVGDTQLQDVGLDISGLGAFSVFPRPGSLMVIFGNFLNSASTYLGRQSSFSFLDGFSTVTLPQQSLNIDGTLLSTSLNHPSTPGERPICVGPEGILFLCDQAAPTPQWQVGAWNSCFRGNQTRIVLCTQGDNILPDAQCADPKPAEVQVCSTRGNTAASL